jgi:hypothetical protein
VPKIAGVFLVLTGCALMCGGQVKIIDTGSTNIPGVNVMLENSGHHAMVERRDGSKQRVKLTKELCDRLLRDLKAAGALSELPQSHCMKSASFGSSLYVEYNGVRSADLSCPQRDERAAAIKKDAGEILSAAKGRR